MADVQSLAPLRVELPYLSCGVCRSQLVNRIFSSAGGLVCLFCARDFGPGELVAVTPDAGGILPGVPVLDVVAAVDVLVRAGARIVDGEVSRG